MLCIGCMCLGYKLRSITPEYVRTCFRVCVPVWSMLNAKQYIQSRTDVELGGSEPRCYVEVKTATSHNCLCLSVSWGCLRWGGVMLLPVSPEMIYACEQVALTRRTYKTQCMYDAVRNTEVSIYVCVFVCIFTHGSNTCFFFV